MLSAMKTESTQERRRRGVTIAVSRGYSKEGIARTIGTTGANLAKLLDRGSNRSQFGPLLDTWLTDNIFTTKAGELPLEAVGQLAQLFEELAEMTRYSRPPIGAIEAAVKQIQGKMLPQVRHEIEKGISDKDNEL